MDQSAPEKDTTGTPAPENNQPQETPPAVAAPASAPESTPSSTPAPATHGMEPAPEPPQKLSKLLVIILVILVIAVVLVGAIYFVLLSGNKKTAGTNLSSEAVAPTPTAVPATPTPTPDLSNSGLQQTSQQVDQQINNLDNLSSKANSAINEQAPNLQ